MTFLNSRKRIFQDSNEKGMAIVMVLTAISIILPVTLFFTLDSNTNKLKVQNIEDRSKARFTSESGLKFAMARLKLYQEAYNYLQKNKAAKDVVSQERLDMLWNQPFMYPIPVGENLNAIQKDTINKFHQENVLDGSFNLTINNISNKINLNMLRISLMQELTKPENGEEDNENETEQDAQFSPETQLVRALTNAIEQKTLTDDAFASKFYGVEVLELANELKYFISDEGSIAQTAGAEINFQDKEMTPKRAPFISFQELYTLPSWPDEIINLIKNEFTVHGALMIDLNQITDKLFRLLIPDALPEDIEEFFRYKDDPQNPQYFNSIDDFKKYVVNIANLMSESDFDERFNKFAAQGLKFGQTATLFKVISSATVGRSTYTISAYVIMPSKPKPRPKNDKPQEDGEDEQLDRPDDPGSPPPPPPPNNTGKEENNTIELLSPRIVEIIIS